ncbi:MAG: TatD family hydrolase [Tepidiformaceae bacterium]
MNTFFDTHSHLQEAAFERDIEAVIERARAAGVTQVAICGWDAQSNVRALEMATGAPGVLATVGYHPHEAKTVTAAMLWELEAQAALAEVAAIGEIGLDFFRDHSPRDVQRRVLQEQLEIAVRLSKPVSLHTRGAETEIGELLEPYAAASPLRGAGGPVGVLHCFGGTLEQALRYVDMGFMISVACTVTYPGNAAGRDVARGVPLESLVIETDSPYLPPQTLRGTRNEPAHVVRAAETIASVRGLSLEAVAAATTANASRSFGVAIAEMAVRA